MSKIDTFRVVGVAVLFVVCVGILVSPTGCQGESLTPLQEYEAALHVYRMERAEFDDLMKLRYDAENSNAENSEVEQKLKAAESRLERAVRLVKDAERRLQP